LPDFLGIGVVRGGTTWLWEHLRHHPEIWLSPVKEISFFDRLFPIPDHAVDPTGEGRRNLLLEKIQHLRFSRWQRYLRNFSLANARWQWRFYRGEPDVDWYRGLFAPAGDRVAGDITPHYSALGQEGVRFVADFLPEVKVILILRDPVARDWSHARFFLSRFGRRPMADIGEHEFIAHFQNPATRFRGDYPRMLDLWQDAIPHERFHLAFFDDLVARPDVFMLRIYRFLGIEASESLLPPQLREQINPARKARIPAAIHRHLAAMHLTNLELLASRLGGHAQTWLDQAREALRGD